jgi:hypothetical membrane protein
MRYWGSKMNNPLLPRIAIGAAGATVVLLGLLHIVSPEFDPSWRMVSEYANGSYGWVLSLMFAAWGVSSLALAYALRPRLKTRSGKIGLILLVVAGVGQLLAAIFDIKHPLHDLVGNVAIPAFAVAAVLISKNLGDRLLKRLAHLTWISVVLLVVSFAVLISTYMQTGADLTATPQPTAIPEGVVALVGWTNRLLVFVYAVWAAATGLWLLHRK